MKLEYGHWIVTAEDGTLTAFSVNGPSFTIDETKEAETLVCVKTDKERHLIHVKALRVFVDLTEAYGDEYVREVFVVKR